MSSPRMVGPRVSSPRMGGPRVSATDTKAAIAQRILDARRRTEELLEPVDDLRLCRQHDALMSPLVWDYGHIAVYEELWLVQRLSGRPPIDSERAHLYDAFEKPRRVRGALPLMDREEAMAYRREVDGRALELLEEADLQGADPLVRDAYVYEMIVQHERQHQETILQALQMLPGGYEIPRLTPTGGDATPNPGASPDVTSNPGASRGAIGSPRSASRAGGAASRAGGAPMPPSPTGEMAAAASFIHDPELLPVAAGRYPIGRAPGAPYDNENGRHEVELAAFAIERFPVTNARYAIFIDEGGYARPELWAREGWAWRCASGAAAPKHWQRSASGWTTERFGDRVPVDPSHPVVHVCWYEADAFARWAGCRLPTEFEWEVAATWDPAARSARPYPWGDDPADGVRANLGQLSFGCSPTGSLPASASPTGCEQMIGDVWEWTSSHFLPYPGFEPFPYPEYSQVFFGDEYRVLRGGSWATHPSVARPTFRNWDFPIRRQLFAGFRCARDGVRP